MSKSKTCIEIEALRMVALEDLMATTDAELRQEVLEDEENLDTVAAQIKSAMREAAAGALRHRMMRAKERIKPPPIVRPTLATRPALDRIKQIVQDIFQKDHSLGLAFRDGKQQSESDWQTLYDDLVTMGAIKPEDDGH